MVRTGDAQLPNALVLLAARFSILLGEYAGADGALRGYFIRDGRPDHSQRNKTIDLSFVSERLHGEIWVEFRRRASRGCSL